MTWQPPQRTAQATAIYAAAEADRAERPQRYRLGTEAILERATRHCDESAFAPGWSEGLGAYLASAAGDGRLNAVGARMVADTAVSRLRGGAAIAAHLAEHPEASTRVLVPPIVITGGWRTGTTFLFRLLATDPRLRALLPVELTAPWRIAGSTGAEREALIDAGAAAHDLLHTLNPQLATIHDSGARLAEECVLAMGTDLRNWGFSSTVRLDGYSAWLATEDLTTSYERYRDVLKILDDGDGRRFLLKAPAHTAELASLVAALPGAVVVHLHRDIVETVASGASLFAVFRSTYSDEVDAADVGRFQTEQTDLWLRRAKAFRHSGEAAAATFVDIAYTDLIAAPGDVVAAVYAAAAMEPPEDVGAFIDRYNAAHPRNDKGVHRYGVADFGLVEPDLRDRFGFYDPPWNPAVPPG